MTSPLNNPVTRLAQLSFTQRHCIVTLTPAQMDLCDDLAARRQAIKVQQGVKTKRFHNAHADLLLHQMAVRSAFAVALMTGGELDISVSARGSKKGAIILPDGERALVRYRNERKRDFALKGTDLEEFTAPVGFLVWPSQWESSGKKLEIIGWTTREDFAAQADVVLWKADQPRLALPYTALRRVQDIVPHGLYRSPMTLATQTTLFEEETE